MALWYLTPVSDLIVDLIIDEIPVQADRELQTEALRDFPYRSITHPSTTEIKRIGKHLVRGLQALPNSYRMQDYNFDFGVIHADFVNAFCLPGGVVRVTDELIRVLDPSPGELAALLGHEIGHVVSRHAQKRLLTERLMSYLLSALVYEDHDQVQETFGQALGELIAKSAKWLGQQKFSRRDEYQADRVAWDLLYESSSHTPQSLESLLVKLESLERGGGSQITAWTQTHPATAARVEAVRERWYGLEATERRRLERLPV